MLRSDGGRTPGTKLLLAILIAAALAIPIFSVWLLVYDRQSQSEQASASITEGWGGPQAISGPVLVIPYSTTAAETVIEGEQSVTRTRQVARELTLSPVTASVETRIAPERRRRSIYEAVVYGAALSGEARFALPADLSRHGVALEDLNLSRAELRFGISDPRGLNSNPRVTANGSPLALQPGGGSGGGRGFFAWIDAGSLRDRPLKVDFGYGLRGNAALTLVPNAGETMWTVRSRWPHPSFGGDFLPDRRGVSDQGFAAVYRIGNLALGRSLVATGDVGQPEWSTEPTQRRRRRRASPRPAPPISACRKSRASALSSRSTSIRASTAPPNTVSSSSASPSWRC